MTAIDNFSPVSKGKGVPFCPSFSSDLLPKAVRCQKPFVQLILQTFATAYAARCSLSTPSSQHSPYVFLVANCTSFCLVLVETARGHQGNGPFTYDTATVAAQAFLFQNAAHRSFFLTSSLSYCCLSAYCRLVCILLIPHCPEPEATADVDLTTSNESKVTAVCHMHRTHPTAHPRITCATLHHVAGLYLVCQREIQRFPILCSGAHVPLLSFLSTSASHGQH